MLEFGNHSSRLIRAVAVMLFCIPSMWGQEHSDFLASLIDQKMILLHFGDQQKVKLKKNNLHKLTGGCDMAVELKQAEWKPGKARLWMHTIGSPHFLGPANAARRPPCRINRGSIEVELSGFSRDESPESVEASVRQLLLTPDEYIVAGGIAFNPAAGVGDEMPVQCVPPIVAAKPLLSMEPEYSDQARKAKYQGTVRIGMIVGTDGRIHKPHITRSLGMGLDEQALYVLPIWRFQPATQAGKPGACEMSIEMSFNLY